MKTLLARPRAALSAAFLLALLALPGSAFAACTSPLVAADKNGAAQNMEAVNTASNNCAGVVSTYAAEAISGNLQSAAIANGNGTSLIVTGTANAVLTVNCASCSGGTTVNFEGSEDGSNYASEWAMQSGTNTLATSTAAAGVTQWQISTAGLQNLRARISGYSAGTVTITAHAVPIGAFPAAAVTQGTSPWANNLSQIGGNATVTGGINGTLGIGGLAASGATQAGNPVKAGGVFNTTQPTVTNGQAVDLQATARGALIVAPGIDGFATNISQFGGNNVVTGTGSGGTGIPRVTVSSDSQVKPWDGTNGIVIKGSGASVVTTDNAEVVALSPNPAPVCTSRVPISQIASTDVLTTTNKAHICSIDLVTDTAQFVSIVEGTGTTCATGITALWGGTTAATGMSFGANGGFSKTADRAFSVTQTTGHHVCILQSGTGRLSGAIWYTDHN